MGTHGASSPAPGPPDLKQVGEIIIESDRQKRPDPLGAEISYGKAMEQGGSPNEDRACQMQLVFLKDDTVLIVDVGIGEIDTENAVVIGKVRPQEEGLNAVDQHLEMRKIARVAFEQAVRTARRSTDVAVAIEHEEAVVMLHSGPQPNWGRGCRQRKWRGGGRLTSRRDGPTFNRHA